MSDWLTFGVRMGEAVLTPRPLAPPAPPPSCGITQAGITLVMNGTVTLWHVLLLAGCLIIVLVLVITALRLQRRVGLPPGGLAGQIAKAMLMVINHLRKSPASTATNRSAHNARPHDQNIQCCGGACRRRL